MKRIAPHPVCAVVGDSDQRLFPSISLWSLLISAQQHLPPLPAVGLALGVEVGEASEAFEENDVLGRWDRLTPQLRTVQGRPAHLEANPVPWPSPQAWPALGPAASSCCPTVPCFLRSSHLVLWMVMPRAVKVCVKGFKGLNPI